MVDFTANNTREEITSVYEVGAGRDIVTELYPHGCERYQESKKEIDVGSRDGAITKYTNKTGSEKPSVDTLTLRYYFNKSLITTSDFLNNVTNSIEPCQVIQQVEKVDKSNDLVIQEDKIAK